MSTRITMASVQVGDVLQTKEEVGGQYVAGCHNGQGQASKARTVKAIEKRQADGGRTGKEYVLTFADGRRTDWRFGTTAHYLVARGGIPVAGEVTREELPPARPGRDESGRVQVVNVPLQGLSSDPERRALDATDAEAGARMAEEVDQDAADGERCEPCKGFGLVRGVGKNAGGRYKTLAGAHAAQDAGRAVDCPSCGGLGLVGLKVDEESADSETVPV